MHDYFRVFFFYCSSHLRDLHSFPTRRSSDLPGCCDVESRPAFLSAAVTCQWAAGRRWPRSEEHTSELQSLRHLVCRLLLEKKKKRTEDKIGTVTSPGHHGAHDVRGLRQHISR